MIEHVVRLENWLSKERKNVRVDEDSPCVRWVCSCGRIGPGVELSRGLIRANRIAERGGASHMSRMTR